MNMTGLLLVGISGICWTIVYIELIRKGIKDKACGMPIFALGLNIVWEFLYSIDGFFIYFKRIYYGTEYCRSGMGIMRCVYSGMLV